MHKGHSKDVAVGGSGRGWVTITENAIITKRPKQGQNERCTKKMRGDMRMRMRMRMACIMHKMKYNQAIYIHGANKTHIWHMGIYK